MGNTASVQRGRRHGLSTATVASGETGTSTVSSSAGSTTSGSGGGNLKTWHLHGTFGRHSRSRQASPARPGGGAAIGSEADVSRGARAGLAVPSPSAAEPGNNCIAASSSSTTTYNSQKATNTPKLTVDMSQPQTVPCQVGVSRVLLQNQRIWLER